MREKVLVPAVCERVVAMRKDGLSYTAIAHATGLHDCQVYWVIKDAGLIGAVLTTRVRKPYAAPWRDVETA